MTQTVAVVATIRAKDGSADDLGAALEALVEATRSERGVLQYDAHRSQADPLEWMVYERWASQAHLDAHMATAHFAEFGARVGEIGDGAPVITLYTPA